MRLLRALSVVALAGLVCGADEPQFWHLGRTEAGAPFAIAYDDDENAPMLRFECAGSEVIGTLFGATKLRDPSTDKKIGDRPGSTIAPEAAQMNLIVDDVSSKYAWAEAKPNSLAGWDLTIRLPNDNPAFLALPRAEMIGFLTTGGGSVTAVEEGDRKRLAEFVRLCREGSAVQGSR
jgi:hypothetical protein